MMRIHGRRPLSALPLLAATLALAAACGGEGDGDGAGTPGDGVRTTVEVTPPEDAPVLTIQSVSLPAGGQGPVELRLLDFPPPGLGAWTVDVAFDPAVVSVVVCQQHEASVCNPTFNERTLRLAGATARGIEGDILLGTLIFGCKAGGTSPLEVAVEVLADATIGAPRPVEALVEDGQLTCG